MTMITPSYLGETIEYSSLHACRSTLEDPTWRVYLRADADGNPEIVDIRCAALHRGRIERRSPRALSPKGSAAWRTLSVPFMSARNSEPCFSLPAQPPLGLSTRRRRRRPPSGTAGRHCSGSRSQA